MIGRNDPCPCGSGKKYKKCCAGKNEVPLEQIVDDELERIVLGVYDQSSDSRDAAEFDKYQRQWNGALDSLWDRKSIEEAVSEYFLFIARRDLWNRHLLKSLNSPLRSAVRSILELWKNPLVLFGKVKGERDGFVEVAEILGNNTYLLEKEQGMPAEKNSVVFGVVLPDNREHPNGLYVITSLMFIRDGNGSFEREIEALAESSGYEKSFDFYKEHMVNIYEILLAKDGSSVDDLIQSDLTPVQQEAVSILESTLEKRGTASETRDLLKNISVTYFLKEQPNFRKPSVMSAAVFRVAIDLGMLDESLMTNVEVAELFDVSTSSMTKQADGIHGFVSEMYERMRQE